MQRHSENLVKALLPLVDKITLIHCVYDGQILPTEAEVKSDWECNNENLSILGFQFPGKGKFPGHYIRNSKKYSHMVYHYLGHRLKEFDLVYAQGFTGGEFIKSKNKYNVPVISNLHGLNMFQPSFGIRAKCEKILLRPLARFILCNSAFVISLGGSLTQIIINQGVRREKILISPNGLPDFYSKLSDVKNNDSKFLFVGRNDKVKGFDLLMRSIPSSPSRFKLSVVGFEEEIEKRSLNVTYLGEIKDQGKLKEVYKNHSVLILPSYSEGMPTVVLEAMACGLAVIASDVGAVSEMVSHQNGWLIPPSNSEALIQAISEAMNTNLEDKRQVSVRLSAKFTFNQIAITLLKDIGLK